jgi:hypothetical protein
VCGLCNGAYSDFFTFEFLFIQLTYFLYCLTLTPISRRNFFRFFDNDIIIKKFNDFAHFLLLRTIEMKFFHEFPWNEFLDKTKWFWAKHIIFHINRFSKHTLLHLLRCIPWCLGYFDYKIFFDANILLILEIFGYNGAWI